MSYSIDLRKKVLSFIDSGKSIEDACHLFTVSRSSIQRWRKRKNETGNIARDSRSCSPYKVDETLLKQYITEYPDAFLNEIAAHFNMTSSGIFRALNRLKITRKKKHRSTLSEMSKKERSS